MLLFILLYVTYDVNTVCIYLDKNDCAVYLSLTIRLNKILITGIKNGDFFGMFGKFSTVCFLKIYNLGPYIESLKKKKKLSSSFIMV